MKHFSARVAFVTGGGSGIRNNLPYILTHAEFRAEVRDIYAALDAAFPQNQHVSPGRQAFEDDRRQLIQQLRTLPAKN